jgi:cell division septation protein DedD
MTGYFMKKFFLCLTLIIITTPILVFSQKIDEEVDKYVKMIDQGETEKVVVESAELLVTNPNHPGILYLQGRLSTDGTEALKYYQAVLDNFPKSQWADDALYYTYQYYYALGLYRTANLKLERLKNQYPNSPYLNLKSSESIITEKKDEVVPENLAVKEETPKTLSSQPETEQLSVSQTILQQAGTPENKSLKSADYTIQVGAFSTLKNAEKQKNYFEDLGYKVDITNKVRSGRSLFLVWVGNYASAEEAVKISYEIKKKYNIEAIIVQRY